MSRSEDVPCSLSDEYRRASFARHFTETRNNSPRNRAGLSIGYQTAISFHDGNDLGGRPCEKALVSNIHVMPRNIRFQRLHSELLSDFKHDRTSNPAKGTCSDRRRHNLAAFDYKDVVGRALSNVSRII